MITRRDKKIIKWVEEHRSITINQCAKIFFTGNKEAYDQARKRLRVIYQEGLLQRYRKDRKHEVVYYIDKKLKIHDLKLLDAVSEILSAAFQKVALEKEKKFQINDRTSYFVDAIMTFEKNGYQFAMIVEIDYTHYTSKGKMTDIIDYLENTFKKSYIFMIVKLSQEKLEVNKLGKSSKLLIVPWNLKNFNEVVAELCSAIQT